MKAAAVAGASLSAVGPEERSSLAGFHVRKMSPAEAPPPFGDKTPRCFLPLPHHSDTCQEPRQRPGAAAHGPDPAPAASHDPGSLDTAVGQSSPGRRRFFSPRPLAKLSTLVPRLQFYFLPRGAGAKRCRAQLRGGRGQTREPKRRQLGRSAGGSAPPPPPRAPSAPRPPAAPRPRRRAHSLLPGFPAPADKGRTRVKIMEGSGEEKAAGLAGGGRWQVPRREGDLPPLAATPQPREPVGAQRK